MEIQVSYPLAFLAGLVSFLSPCVLPVVPSYLAFVSGLTFGEMAEEDAAEVHRVAVVNSVLFVMIGIEVLIIEFAPGFLLAGLMAIPLVLLARLISVALPVLALRSLRTFSPHAVKILTWSGLRGGISVALALSLPPGETRDLFVTVTYLVVTFSIVIQGLTVGRVARRLST